MTIEIQPQLVMRSVIGHLAAMGVGRYKKGPMTEPIRDYILDESQPLPGQLRFYYWMYPFRPQVLIRDACMMIVSSDTAVAFWLMKFFPLAFLVTFDEPEQRQFQELDLDRYRNAPARSNVPVHVNLRPVVHERWPEAPTDNSAILYGAEAVMVNPRDKIMRT